MTKPKSKTISAPFDARHVGGVSIPVATVPIAGIERSSTTLEPDTAPSHTFVAHGNIEVPRRSNTVASALGRPSLTLKTSISLLRGRSNSNTQATESADGNSKGNMPVRSLRKKASTSRFWQKAHHETPAVESPQEDEEAARDVPPAPLHKDTPVLRTKPSSSFTPSVSTTNPYIYQSTVPPPPPPPPASEPKPTPPHRARSQKKPPVVRSKRADSATAIDLDDVLVAERPLGFREILAVSSFSERMSLYKKTREYWAHANHGLGEWVDRSKPRPTFRVGLFRGGFLAAPLLSLENFRMPYTSSKV
ncbi:hypothetical protein P171DRAFT_267181 [Karstenula rhodostoma CBS 690.94]|uniref:Uncharacterized protein n=1 Tax=Karstenula rhodostoma CBS 690.94 TaxID=1392251 RepID=A0A9P4UCV0_9PLEO|nr:hypothetical protein P171DRAFT_267181 [Karstenula rhodostoma CBS 690.94]